MKIRESLALDQVTVGERLAEPVLGDGGNVLLPAGAELTESMLASLQRRGVAMLMVEREVAEDPAALEARRQALTAQLDHLFRHAGEGRAVQALYQAVLAFRMEQGK